MSVTVLYLGGDAFFGTQCKEPKTDRPRSFDAPQQYQPALRTMPFFARKSIRLLAGDLRVHVGTGMDSLAGTACWLTASAALPASAPMLA